MSDQAKPAEIEDVLSSIRRLVAGNTESAAPTSKSAGSETEQIGADAPEPALVLTPSLLVEQQEESFGEQSPGHEAWAEDAKADQEDASAAGEQTDPEEAVDASSDSEDDVVAPVSVEADTLDDIVAEAGADPSEPQGPALEFEHRKSPFLSETLVAKRAAELGEAAPPSDRRSGFGFGSARREDPVRHVPLSDLGPATSAKDVADEETDDQHERTLNLSIAPEPSGEDAVPEHTEAATPLSKRTDPIISPGFAIPTQSPGASPRDAEIGEASKDPEASVDEALVEQVVAESDAPPASPPEDDVEKGIEPGGIPAEPTAIAQEEDFLTGSEPSHSGCAPIGELDEGEDAPVAQAMPSRDPAEDDALNLNVFGEPPKTWDEDALRALIADVVRSELQGTLGERVSNNIRTLIRREIVRALAEESSD